MRQFWNESNNINYHVYEMKHKCVWILKIKIYKCVFSASLNCVTLIITIKSY